MVQKRKRQYWRETQVQLLDSCNNSNPNEFWKTIGKIGMGLERTKQIPMEVLQSDGTPSSSLDNIIEKWQNTFEQLYQACPQNSSNESESSTVSI